MLVSSRINMVVSLNRGAIIYTPQNARVLIIGTPLKKGIPNLGEAAYLSIMTGEDEAYTRLTA